MDFTASHNVHLLIGAATRTPFRLNILKLIAIAVCEKHLIESLVSRTLKFNFILDDQKQQNQIPEVFSIRIRRKLTGIYKS